MKKIVVVIFVILLAWILNYKYIPKVKAFESPIQWVAFGDSITAGTGATNPGKSFIHLVEQEVGTIDNRGASSSKIENQLGYISAYTGTATNVIWLSGYNDMRGNTSLSDYENYLRFGLAILRQRGNRVYLGTCLRMTPAGYQAYSPNWNYGSDSRVVSFISIQRQVSSEFPNVFIAETSAFYNPQNVYTDLVHPNDVGHAQIAAAFNLVISSRPYRIPIPIVVK